MKKSLSIMIAMLISIFFISGCLLVEKKVFKLTLTGANSGKGSIKYVNILSQKEDGKDKTMKDFAELISDYLEGDKVKDTYPGIKNVKKRVFEENGVLCGEFTFDFDSLEAFKIYRYDNDSPYMLVMEDMMGEEYAPSNGEYGRINAKIVFWNKKQKEFTWETKMNTDTNCVSLLDSYKKWEKGK
jgi:hypothetical protein